MSSFCLNIKVVYYLVAVFKSKSEFVYITLGPKKKKKKMIETYNTINTNIKLILSTLE